MNIITSEKFNSVYGPVKSWRYGQSLGIDPIGRVSTCSFNCVYCQLGEIEVCTNKRQIFVPTSQIIEDLQAFKPWNLDVITISGSGEPTLALNLGEIITKIQEITAKKVVVLTNATLLEEPEVRADLALADEVSVKIDAVFTEDLHRINRPFFGINLQGIEAGIKQFRSVYHGKLSVQTMILTSWNKNKQDAYVELIKSINPDEIQLNTPTRPKPLTHELETRGNHSDAASRLYPVQILKRVSVEVLADLATKIEQATGIIVRYCK